MCSFMQHEEKGSCRKSKTTPSFKKRKKKKKVHIFSLFLKPNRLSRLIDQRGIWTWNMQCEELYTLIAK